MIEMGVRTTESATTRLGPFRRMAPTQACVDAYSKNEEDRVDSLMMIHNPLPYCCKHDLHGVVFLFNVEMKRRCTETPTSDHLHGDPCRPA